MQQKEVKEKVIETIESDPYKDAIKSISVFGSYLHGDAQPDSDIDLIVDFKKPIGLFKFMDIKFTLEDKLGRKVDLVTPNGLSKYIRPKVLREAQKIYESK